MQNNTFFVFVYLTIQLIYSPINYAENAFVNHKGLGKVNDKQTIQDTIPNNGWQLTETKTQSTFSSSLPYASRVSFRCGNANLIEENNALWPVLGEWEGVSESGKNSLIHMIGCDGRITTFKRPTKGHTYFKPTLSSIYHFEYAPNPYVIKVPTPNDKNYPIKQVGMTLHNKDYMTFDIEHFYPVNLKRTSRETCLHSAMAIEQSADIALSPQFYFPELKKEREPLRKLFRAIEKRDSWEAAKQKISYGLSQAEDNKFLNKETGEYQSIDDLLGTVGADLLLSKDNPLMKIANIINIGSHLLAKFVISSVAAENDEYVRDLLDIANQKLPIARLSNTLCQMKLIDDYYWDHIEKFRENNCRAKYGAEGDYPLNTIYPVIPFSPIDINRFLPAASATRDEHMTNSLIVLLKLAKKYHSFKCSYKKTALK